MEADPGAPEASDSEHEVDSNASFGHETSGTSNDEEIFDGSSSQDESDAEQDAAGDGVAAGDVHDAAADDDELHCDECDENFRCTVCKKLVDFANLTLHTADEELDSPSYLASMPSAEAI